MKIDGHTELEQRNKITWPVGETNINVLCCFSAARRAGRQFCYFARVFVVLLALVCDV